MEVQKALPPAVVWGAEGKRAAGGRFAAGESDPQAGRETSRKTSVQPAMLERPDEPKSPRVAAAK